jgi:hypothetical protein
MAEVHEKSRAEREAEEEQERCEVLERIKASSFLNAFKQLPGLLTKLYEHRHVRLPESELVHLAFGGQFATTGNVRKHTSKLTNALRAYNEVDLYDEDWRFSLPKQVASEGYQLQVVNLRESIGPVHAFWRAHLKPSRPVAVICNEPMFFRNEAGTAFVRKPGGSQGEETQPCYHYLLSGEVGARERLSEWFDSEGGVRTVNKVSRLLRLDDIANWSPIVLGNRRSSGIIEGVSKWHQYRRFGYHIESEPHGAAVIVQSKDYNKEEEQVARFHPTRTENGWMLRDDPRPDQIVFATVTRLPNRHDTHGGGAVTIISAAYTKVIEEVAYSLTDNARLSVLLKESGWKAGTSVPRYFQWLLSVRLGSPEPDDRSAAPKLRCFRQFEKFMSE